MSRSNPHAKRLYDDLLHDYNRLIRPVQNFTETLTVNLGLKLSQLIDVVRFAKYVLGEATLKKDWKEIPKGGGGLKYNKRYLISICKF